MKETLEIGNLIDSTAQRDAIHIAVAPAVAGEQLYPAQRVGLKAGCAVPRSGVFAGRESDPVGIVDPFLRGVVPQGAHFWIFLFPQTVTGMRHHWEHPAFSGATDTNDPREWMKSFAEKAGLSYDRVMEITEDFLETDDAWVELGSSRARDTFYEHEREFWENYEAITGKKLKDGATWTSPFSCSC